MKKGIYPGSFDPVTLGHLDIIMRASKLADELIVGVLVNKSKQSLFTLDERVELLKRVTKDMPNVTIKSFDGLLVDFAEEEKADFIVRGLRAVTDFEYEIQLAHTNHRMRPEVDTVFLTTTLQYSFVSSSLVREIASYGGDISAFVPECIEEDIYKKYGFNK
ncbi:MAG: pantetheine-phosphate adenylyltransferase [Lachnospiraceae bacterium]|nr:pantetheine-phosphate adenylyltransferase [Lachnospiraceae bacterium]